MFKQLAIYLILSIVVVIFSHYVYLGIVYLDMFIAYLSLKLRPVFAWTGFSYSITKTLVLVLVPIIITLIPAIIYRLYKKKSMPHFIAIAWCLWWVLVLSNALIH